jgi:RNA polymerase sigma-70 factor (ECF subfamily)
MELGRLIEEHLPRAYGLARSIAGSSADAEDALGSAVAQVLAHPERYDPARPFFPFFAGFVIRVALGQERAKRRRAVKEGAAVQRSSQEAPASELERREARQAVRAALADLAPEERAAVLLTHVEDLSQADAGEILGLPQRTVSDLARRGKEKLGAALARLGYAGAALGPLFAAATCEPVPAALGAKLNVLLAAKATFGTAVVGAQHAAPLQPRTARSAKTPAAGRIE